MGNENFRAELRESRWTVKENVILVPLNRMKYKNLFKDGNTILYFENQSPPRCFEEIVLSKFQKRAALWQEHSENKSDETHYLLKAVYSDSKKI